MCNDLVLLGKKCSTFEDKASKAFIYTRIILCMHPANEGWHCNITLSLIAWAHTQNDLCLEILDVQISCNDLTTWQGTRIVVSSMATRVTYHIVTPNLHLCHCCSSGRQQGWSAHTLRRDEAGPSSGRFLWYSLHRDISQDTARRGRRILHPSTRN